MNVLMVTSSYPRFPGDVVAPFIESIAHAMVRRGHAVDVVLPHHPALARGAGEPVRFFPYRYAPTDGLHLWGYAQSLAADVRVRPLVYAMAPLAAVALRGAVSARLVEGRYDVVHVHWLVPSAALVADVVSAHGVPLVVSLHGSDVFLAERLRPARWLAAAALAAAGAVTACSGDLRRRALALGAPAGRTTTVPYGVDAEAFAVEPEPLRARLGLAPGTLLVVAVGRLVEKKGFATLVEAAAALGTRVHVAIAGGGDLGDALRAQAGARRAPVTLLGPLERPAVAAALAAADVVAVPSVVDAAGNVDGLPNVLLEALAAGRAVVASRVAGIPEVVDDGTTGLLVPPGDAPALAAALERLAADPALRARLGASGRARVARDLSWDAAARRVEESYAAAAALRAR